MSEYHQGYNKLIDELEKEGILYDYYDCYYYNYDCYYKYYYNCYYVKPDIDRLKNCHSKSALYRQGIISRSEYNKFIADLLI